MLSAIREIGKWQIQKSGTDELNTLVQEPFKSGKVVLIKQEPFKSGKVVLIKIDIDEKVYDDVELEGYDSSKRMKYLFRKGPSKGPNPTPTAKITDVKTTFKNKIQNWFTKHINLSIEEVNFLESIKNILSDNKDKIIRSIQTCIKNINKKVIGKGKICNRISKEILKLYIRVNDAKSP